MTELFHLKNSSFKRKKVQRVGRGPGSGRGKTSCRGQKGAKSRSGYRRRYGYEGGQARLFTKLPKRGFSRGRHLRPFYVINVGHLGRFFKDGEVVSLENMRQKRAVPADRFYGLKILGEGELKIKPKKVFAEAISASAKQKLQDQKIDFELAKKKEKKEKLATKPASSKRLSVKEPKKAKAKKTSSKVSKKENS